MGLLSRLAAWVRKDTDALNPESWFTHWLGGGSQSSSGITVTQFRAMQDLTFMACVSARAGDLAKCPIHVYRRRSNGAHVIEKNNPLERVLQKPNDWQTRLEFIEQMQAALLLKSNAYAAIRWDGRGAPVALIPIWPDRVQLYEAPTGELFYRVTSQSAHERAQLRGFIDPIPAEDMLHLRWVSFSGLLGLSRIHLARDALGLSLALGEHSSRLFANGTRPGGHFETDKRMSDDVFKRFKAQLEDYRGVENFGKNLILEEGLKWQAAAMTAVESQTIEARRFQTQQIAMACDVPLHRLGIIQDKDSAILQAQQMYRNNTLSGDAERWETKLDWTFRLDGEELFTAFDLDYFNRADLQTRMTAYRIGIIGTIMTPNEARRKEGLPDDPAGNVLLQPANVVPLGTMPSTTNPSGPGSDVTGAPAPGGDGDPAAVPAVLDVMDAIETKVLEAIREGAAIDMDTILAAIREERPDPLDLGPIETKLLEAIRDRPAPAVNVTVPIALPRSGGERTVVTEHDAQGRIKTFERHQIEE